MDIDTLRSYDELFKTAGWKLILEECDEEIKALEVAALESAKSFEEVCYYRGQAHQLMKLLTLENTLIQMVQVQQQEDEEDDDDASL